MKSILIDRCFFSVVAYSSLDLKKKKESIFSLLIILNRDRSFLLLLLLSWQFIPLTNRVTGICFVNYPDKLYLFSFDVWKKISIFKIRQIFSKFSNNILKFYEIYSIKKTFKLFLCLFSVKNPKTSFTSFWNFGSGFDWFHIVNKFSNSIN